MFVFFFFKQKTAYEMRISDWSSDVCSSDLHYSGWAGSLALAIIVIPVVVRSTDNMLTLVPNTLREAAAALGCPQWRIVVFISYRAARSGIITGVLLAVARIAGETAPLLFTALNNQFRSEEHTSELQSLLRLSYAVFCLKKKN